MNKSCLKCNSSCTLARDTSQDGSTQVFWWCVHCWNYADPFHAFMAHDYLRQKGVGIDTLPIIDRWPDDVVIPCAVMGCKNKGVQSHHWAPKYIFKEEAELWPQAYLCKPHHDEWHNKVTSNMRQHVNGPKGPNGANGNGKVKTYATEPTKA